LSRPETDLQRQRAVLAEGLCAAVRTLAAHGWCRATSGNFSAVLAWKPLCLLITRSGLFKDRLEPGDLVAIDGDARPLPDEAGRPSAEALLHCAIARATGAGAVLHTHSVAATLLGARHAAAGGLAISGYEMLKALEGVESHEEEVFVPVLPNSQDIGELCRGFEALARGHARLRGFLIAGHGLYAWGADVEAARRHVEGLEFLLECEARRTGLGPIG
jgi:methylthioribulose-1-phosphate dehydratase